LIIGLLLWNRYLVWCSIRWG